MYEATVQRRLDSAVVFLCLEEGKLRVLNRSFLGKPSGVFADIPFESITAVMPGRPKLVIEQTLEGTTKEFRLTFRRKNEFDRFWREFTTLNKIDSVEVMIPNSPLTNWEQLSVGMTTLGLFGRSLRAATLVAQEGRLTMVGKTEDVAGGKVLVIARLAFADVTRVEFIPIEIRSQLTSEVKRALVIGGGFSATVFLLALSRAGVGPGLWLGLLFSLVVGLLAGLLFSFVPALFRVHRNLAQLRIIVKDGTALILAVTDVSPVRGLLLQRGIPIVPVMEQASTA